MTALSVLCALLCAAANAAVSVLQRLAALGPPTADNRPGGHWAWLLRSRAWWAGFAALLLAAVAQAAALGLGSLSLVQPLLTSELLFALVIGRLVFRRDPGRRTWAAFAALAVGLALFLAATDPQPGGGAVAPGGRWLVVALAVSAVIVVLVAAAWKARGAGKAVLLGCATATGFALTAALVKETLTRVGASGFAQLWTDWPVYALAVTGGGSFALLQVTLRAGTLRASQPALTLVDAMVSLALGRVLFADRLSFPFGAVLLGAVLAVVGGALMVAGVLGLVRSDALASAWDVRAAPRERPRPDRGPGPGLG
ncbi:DMT family transporter [Streptacidiphilus rugosus]|uniref:DMT family transporter n=1 Tax=Streptacidiphilus rugosus TaxID=405783 RepID=UPI0005612A90|nr:DMT family transporter [Streptacidiphilus rugosus]